MPERPTDPGAGAAGSNTSAERKRHMSHARVGGTRAFSSDQALRTASGSLPWLGPVLEVSQERRPMGVFGIGMRIDLQPPHRVTAVDNLVDPRGVPIAGIVGVGDLLRMVDGVAVGRKDNPVNLEKVIPGELGSVAKLTFQSRETNAMYKVDVQRHTPIAAWDANLKFVSLDPSQRGKLLAAEAEVVDRLEAIRSAILQPWGQPVDFLKRNSFDQAGPGLHFGLEAKTAYKWRPCQISQVVPGGAAWACGELMEGDEVVAVDGEKASQDTIMAALQGSKFSIGSESELTIMRGHAERKVVLSRSSELFTQTVSDAVETLGLLRQRIREVCDEKLSQDLSNLNAKLENQIRAHEMLRIRNEIALADKFSAAHLSVVDQIDATEMMLYRWPETVAEDRFDHTMTLHEHIAVLEETIEMHVREKTEHQLAIHDFEIKMAQLVDEISYLKARQSTPSPEDRKEAAVSELEALRNGLERNREVMNGMVPKAMLEETEHARSQLKTELDQLKMHKAGEPSLSEFYTLKSQLLARTAELTSQERKCAQTSERLAAQQQECQQLEACVTKLKRLLAQSVQQSELTAAQQQNTSLQETLTDLKKQMSEEMVAKALLIDAQSACKHNEDRYRSEVLKTRALIEELSSARSRACECVERKHLEEVQAEMAVAKAQAAEKDRKNGEYLQTIGELQETLQGLRKVNDEKTAKLEHMVPRAELERVLKQLTASQNETAAALVKIDALQQQGHELKIQCAELEDEKSRLASELKMLGSRDANDSQNQRQEQERRQIEELQSSQFELKATIGTLKDEAEKYKAELADSIPTAEHAKVQALCASQNEKLAHLKRELSIALTSKETQRAQLNKAVEEACVMRKDLAGMIAKHEYLEVKAMLEDVQTRAQRKGEEAAACEADNRKLQAELLRVQQELNSLQTQTALHMVDRDIFEQRDTIAKIKEEEVERLSAEVSENLKVFKQFQEYAAGLKSKNIDLQATIASKAELGTAGREQQESVTRLEKQVQARDSQLEQQKQALHRLENQIELLRMEAMESVPRTSLATTAHDLELLSKRCESLKIEKQNLLLQVQTLQETHKEVATENSELKLSAVEMVEKSELEAVQNELRRTCVQREIVVEELQEAKMRVVELEERMDGMVKKDDMLMASQRFDKLSRELEQLQRLLAQGGLADSDILFSLIDALSRRSSRFSISAKQVTQLLNTLHGKDGTEMDFADVFTLMITIKDSATVGQGVSCADLVALLNMMTGSMSSGKSEGPRRSIKELMRILRVLNEPEAIFEDDLITLRTALRAGMCSADGERNAVPLTVADAAEMVSKCGSVVNLETMQSELDDLRTRYHEVEVQLRSHEEDAFKKQRVHESTVADLEKNINTLRDLNHTLEAQISLQRPPCAPIVDPQGGCAFEDTLCVKVLTPVKHATLFVTTDGSEPGLSNWDHTGQSPVLFSISSTCLVRAVVIGEDGIASKEVSETYTHCTPPKRAGVGLLLQSLPGLKGVYIKSVAPAGAAAKDGKIREGDELMSVDEVSVSAMRLSDIFQLIQGPEGSRVKFKLLREDRNGKGRQIDGSGSVFEVTLTRSVASEAAVRATEGTHWQSPSNVPRTPSVLDESPRFSIQKTHEPERSIGPERSTGPEQRMSALINRMQTPFSFLSAINPAAAINHPPSPRSTPQTDSPRPLAPPANLQSPSIQSVQSAAETGSLPPPAILTPRSSTAGIRHRMAQKTRPPPRADPDAVPDEGATDGISLDKDVDTASLTMSVYEWCQLRPD